MGEEEEEEGPASAGDGKSEENTNTGKKCVKKNPETHEKGSKSKTDSAVNEAPTPAINNGC